ncbi:Enterochelin esterase [Prosthecobacter debontii]|uniref:Enterochelin esterase n=2 Tax=Prosthecobacter debontii TaxID=48467 RepID=A0A1T4Y9X4_9BACT|nr:Enterochelin esterase [Prosthecobacter debontii]
MTSAISATNKIPIQHRYDAETLSIPIIWQNPVPNIVVTHPAIPCPTMKYLSPLLGLLSLTVSLSAAEPEFPLTADSKSQPGVPQGSLIKDTYTARQASVFPGTQRDYQIYIPAGLDRDKSAAFMVFQDGVLYQAPVVFDNLIAKKDIPPLIGIFIRPGVVPAANDNALPRFNRSYEYDSVTAEYSRFLLDEFLPAIEQKHRLSLSTNPDQAAIAGNSSGGICAYMVAWHRPDRFHRVFTGVGTYVGIHGADQLPVLVRKIEPKPLRVFLQSGTNDNNLYCGDWWMANQMMERSLTWAGYEVNHAWGEGGHNQKHASQVFPDALRWLWKDWQTNLEVKANVKGESKWKGYEVVDMGAWQPLASPKGAQGHVLQSSVTGEISLTATANARTRLQGQTSLPQPALTDDWASSSTTLSPDQTLLYAKKPDSEYVYSFPVGGLLSQGQKFYQLDALQAGDTHSGGLCVDTEGRLYVATSLGIQVCDQAGRVNFIIPTPTEATDVCFGGKDLSELVIACRDTLYKRPTKVHGVVSGQQAPIKPKAPKL